MLCAATMPFVVFIASQIGEVEPQRINLPVLECTVICAHGRFDGYSVIPIAGDVLVIDANALRNADYKGMLQFETKGQNQRGVVYIPVSNPFRLDAIDQNKQGVIRGYRLVAVYGAKPRSAKHTLDIIKPNDAKTRGYEIFLTYEYDQLVRGVVVLEGRPKRSKKKEAAVEK